MAATAEGDPPKTLGFPKCWCQGKYWCYTKGPTLFICIGSLQVSKWLSK